MKLNIDKVLKEKGLSAVGLSELMAAKGNPLSRISIGSIINGNSSPKLETLQDIAMALEIPLCDLFDGYYVPKESTPIFKKDDNGNYIEIGYLKG
jgi:transcriptional regulator with XRE-family HTH domain